MLNDIEAIHSPEYCKGRVAFLLNQDGVLIVHFGPYITKLLNWTLLTGDTTHLEEGGIYVLTPGM